MCVCVRARACVHVCAIVYVTYNFYILSLLYTTLYPHCTAIHILHYTVYCIELFTGITTDNTLIIWVAIGGMLISILVIIFAVLLVTIVIMKRRLFTKYETFE